MLVLFLVLNIHQHIDAWNFLCHPWKVICRLNGCLESLRKPLVIFINEKYPPCICRHTLKTYISIALKILNALSLTDLPERPFSFGQFDDHVKWDHGQRWHGQKPTNPVSPPGIHIRVVELHWSVSHDQKYKSSLERERKQR